VMSAFTADQIKASWKQQVNAARIAWTRLSVDELLGSEGCQDRLAKLVQERYALSSDEASRRVRNFMEVR